MNRQRPWLPALGLTVLLAVLAGCGQPGKWQIQSLDTASEGSAGSILVTDTSFVYATPVEHGAVYQPGETMPLQATIVNRGSIDDRLLSVRSPIAKEVEVRGATTVRAGQSLAAGYTDPVASIAVGKATRIDIKLKGLRKPVRSGPTYPVVFTFAKGGKLRLEVAVQNPDTAREECPLPPEGKPHRTLVAPPSGAPKPKGPPVPGCSSLTDEPDVQILDFRAPLSRISWSSKDLVLRAVSVSPQGKRLVRIDPLTGEVKHARELRRGEDPARLLPPEPEAGDVARAAHTAVPERVQHVAVNSEHNRVFAVTAKKVFTLRAETFEILAVTDYRSTLRKAPEPSLAEAKVADVAANADHVFLALEGEPHIVEVKATKK